MALEHEGYLVELLRPLGTYDLRRGAVNRGELAAYGVELDKAGETLNAAAREMNLTTAEDFGLELVEKLLPYRPVCETAEQRREALAALLRISGDSFTPAAINDTLKGCGINAQAVEGGQPNCVEVWFPDVAGIPDGFERLRAIIEEILPCHLGITYSFWYNIWLTVEERHASWGQISSAGLSWYGLATEKR